MTADAIRLQAPSLYQWHAAKTTGAQLDLVFQNIADNDGDVEQVTHVGGRDFIVFYSKPVER